MDIFIVKSSFYTATDFMSDDKEYKFTTGVNKLFGEIDSKHLGSKLLFINV